MAEAVRDGALELQCPQLGAWFDCEAATTASRTVRLCDPEHCRAAGASWSADLTAEGSLDAAPALLRPRSDAMQDGDCDAVTPGARVLCLRRASGAAPLWVDATITSVTRFPHRAGGECQCLFSVRWPAGVGADEEEVQVERLCLRPGALVEASTPHRADEHGPAAPPAGGAASAALADGRVRSAVCAFFQWCSLREQALVARRAGQPPPWCPHPLLARFHFCNVSRLDDRGTAAFHAFLRTQRVRSLAGALWCSLVYRRLNRLTTFADWGGRLPLPREAAAWAAWVARRAADPCAAPLFTSKHQQSGGVEGYLATVRGLAGLQTPPLPGFPHARSLAQALLRCEGAREAHGTLKAHCRHVGDFIAWQVLCDLVEAGQLPQAASDDWVALGPGAKAGLQLIFGEGGDAEHRLRVLQAAQPWALQALRRDSHGGVRCEDGAPALLLRDLEHSLCEFQKWYALRRGWCTPGAYAASEQPLPMLPAMRVERLEGTRFRVLQPEGTQQPDEQQQHCAAFPPADVAAGEEEAPELPPWLPRESGARKRARASAGGPRPPRPPKQAAGPRPERAALNAWFDSFWPGALLGGWTSVTKTRQGGATAGTTDSYWLSPAGKRFRSRAEVAASQGFEGAPPAEVVAEE
jgi:hypothetical protein